LLGIGQLAKGEDKLLSQLQQLTDLKIQLLGNPLFDNAVKTGSIMHKEVPPWSIPSGSKEAFVIEKENSFLDGHPSIGFSGGNRGLWQKFSNIPSGNFKIIIWCKGKGQVNTRIMLGVKEKKPKGKILWERFVTKIKKLSPDWKKLEWEIELPSQIEKNGTSQAPEAASFQIFSRGGILIGAAAIVPDDYQKSLARMTAKAEPIRPPVLTIPRLKKPPVIDGKFNENEWKAAAAISGFSKLGDKYISKRQTTVYLGYDQERLYVAWVTPQTGRIVMGSSKPNTAPASRTDGVEFWTVSPSDSNLTIQFYGMPAGGYLQLTHGSKAKRSLNWNYKSGIKDISRLVAGIETFDSKLWVAELSVPLADIGISGNATGQTVKMNFCRVYSPPPGMENMPMSPPANNTCWSPLSGGFYEPQNFGKIIFGNEKPVFRCRKYEISKDNDWQLAGNVLAGDDTLLIKGDISIGRLDLVNKAQTAEPGKNKIFKFNEKIPINEPTVLVSRIELVDRKSGQELYRQEGKFKIESSFDIEVVPVLSQNQLKIGFQTDKLKSRLKEYAVKIDIVSTSGNNIDSKTMTVPAADGLQIASFDISKLQPGNYKLSFIVRDSKNQKSIISETRTFAIKAKPAWLNNKLGKSDQVPPPWHPLKISGSKIKVLLRDYELENSGLPAQIVVSGKKLFSKPAYIKLRINGNSITCQFDKLKLRKKEDTKAVWNIKGTAGPLTITGTLAVEFDGFADWNITFSSQKPVRIDELALVFPFAKDRALIARGANRLKLLATYCAALFTGRPPSSSYIAHQFYSDGGWAWPNEWLSQIWVGDDRCGFEMMCESPRNHFGKLGTVIKDRERGGKDLIIHLISEKHKLQGKLSYSYMWQATPVKTYPESPKFRHSSRVIDDEAGFIKRGVYVYRYIAFKKVGIPELVKDFWYKGNVARYDNKVLKNAGLKILPYFSTIVHSDSNPETQAFLPYWRQRPHSSIAYGSGLTVLCSNGTSFDDYLCHALSKSLNEFGLGGLYLDVSGPQAYHNPYAGIGYYDEKTHEWKSIVTYKATRELYKRLYNINNQGGKATGLIMHHTMPAAAIAGFANMVNEGESWGIRLKDRWHELTPEMFRTREARNQYGPVYLWHAMWYYWGAARHGGRSPLSEVLAYCLPHNVLPHVSDKAIFPVWDIMDKYYFNNSKFIPYWAPESPLQTGSDKKITGSVFVSNTEKRALIVVSNWNDDWRNIPVKFAVRTLDAKARNLNITRAVKHPMLGYKVKPGRDPMKNSPIAVNDGNFDLRIAPRNLEILEAVWE
jgi:hypothetical protein